MPQYLLTNYLPDNFDPSTVDEATINAINALNEELIAAGARLMAAGLAPASQAKSLRTQPDGELLITDGPYLEAKEHVGVGRGARNSIQQPGDRYPSPIAPTPAKAVSAADEDARPSRVRFERSLVVLSLVSQRQDGISRCRIAHEFRLLSLRIAFLVR